MDEAPQNQNEPLATPNCDEPMQQEYARSSNSPEQAQKIELQNFEAVSNVPNEPLNYENRLYQCSESVVTEEDQPEQPSDTELSCVDYLEMIHEEMLNPEVSLASESEIQDEKPIFICKHSQCGFRTIDAESFLKHTDEHNGEKLYRCDICHVKFTLFSNMRRHRMSHTGHKPYECTLCTKIFYRKDHLVEHLVRQHTKQRPYRCVFCCKYFKLRPQLKLHLFKEHYGALMDKPPPDADKCHFAVCLSKQSPAVTESNECSMSQNQLVSSESNAIDLGAISQNFSFIPAQYPQYSIVTGENSHSLPGPSDLTRVVTRVVHTTTPAVHTISTGAAKKEQSAVEHLDQTTSSRVSTQASSTTTLSPNTCQENACHTNNTEFTRDQTPNIRIFVKSEPSDLTVDDSQNGSTLPTSTMDLTTTSIVETTYNSNEATCHRSSPEAVLKKKPKYSSGEEENSERFISPSTQHNVDSGRGHNNETAKPLVIKVKCSHTRKETSSLSGQQDSRHSQLQRCNSWGTNRGHSLHANTENSNWRLKPEGRRSCRDKSTTTDLPMETPFPRNQALSASAHRSDVPHASCQTDDCSDSKNHLLIRKVESNSLMCPHCEIIFPDQTLYFLHRSLHTDSNPWKCNLCGKHFKDKYEFNSHVIGQGHH